MRCTVVLLALSNCDCVELRRRRNVVRGDSDPVVHKWEASLIPVVHGFWHSIMVCLIDFLSTTDTDIWHVIRKYHRSLEINHILCLSSILLPKADNEPTPIFWYWILLAELHTRPFLAKNCSWSKSKIIYIVSLKNYYTIY